MSHTSQHSPYSTEKAVRLEARLSRDQKNLLQHAADFLGRSLSDFILTVSQEAATKVIREHAIITLSVKESENFINILLHSPTPNALLKRAAKRYKKFQGSGR